jgi:hypothetical protein
LITGGKSRDTVETAKQYLKHTPGPEAEALAIKAYTARIEALQASGMHREAQALSALVHGQVQILASDGEQSMPSVVGLSRTDVC